MAFSYTNLTGEYSKCTFYTLQCVLQRNFNLSEKIVTMYFSLLHSKVGRSFCFPPLYVDKIFRRRKAQADEFELSAAAAANFAKKSIFDHTAELFFFPFFDNVSSSWNLITLTIKRENKKKSSVSSPILPRMCFFNGALDATHQNAVSTFERSLLR